MTMTRGELLIVLYDETIKRLLRGKIALENKDFETFEKSVERAKEIIDYLKATLDFKYQISRELNNMYDFFLYEIVRIKAGRNPKVIDELIPLVKEMRDAFREAEKSAGV